MKTMKANFISKCNACGEKIWRGDLIGKISNRWVCGLCVEEHKDEQLNGPPKPHSCLGEAYSLMDPFGVYTPEGKKIGSTCNCIDYPCCGH